MLVLTHFPFKIVFLIFKVTAGVAGKRSERDKALHSKSGGTSQGPTRMNTFSTPRLTVKSWHDFPPNAASQAILALLGDTRVNAKLPWSDVTTLDRAQAWLDEKKGGLTCPVFRKEGGVFLGIICVVEMEGHGKMEVGYMLKPEHWGKGYATEVVQGLVAHFFEANSDLLELHAYTATDNVGSQKVLLKNGIQLVDGGAVVVKRGGDRIRFVRER